MLDEDLVGSRESPRVQRPPSRTQVEGSTRIDVGVEGRRKYRANFRQPGDLHGGPPQMVGTPPEPPVRPLGKKKPVPGQQDLLAPDSDKLHAVDRLSLPGFQP